MSKKAIGILLIILGTALGLWGYDIYNAATSQITRAFSGDTPMEAWGGMLGGFVLIIVGITRLK